MAGREGDLQRAERQLSAALTAALRRRLPHEARLAGALRVLGPQSDEVREMLGDVVGVLGKRGAYDRPLFVAAARTLGELGDERGGRALGGALGAGDGVATGVLAAASFCRDEGLRGPLVRAAASRQPQVAFAAEVARLLREESRGEGLASLALRLKEASRIELCNELFGSLRWRTALRAEVAPALAVLRGAERHLGRWLLLAEVAVQAGDETPERHAQRQSTHGPVSARGAWRLVRWALRPTSEPPAERASLDVLARLSDRPSVERDLTFLFRLAEARALQLKSHLEGLAGRLNEADEQAVRAAFYLARDHGRDDLRRSLRGVIRSKREGGWGLAAAALHDLGEREGAEEAAAACLRARSPAALGWGWLVRSALGASTSAPLLTEAHVRRLNLGLLA